MYRLINKPWDMIPKWLRARRLHKRREAQKDLELMAFMAGLLR